MSKKQKALRHFSKKLLSSDAGKNIERIVLFGSLASGKANKSSDIDVLLFSSTPNKVKSAVWDATLDTFSKYRESVEPIIYPLKKYRKPDSYFLHYSIRKGKQLHP